MAANVEIKAVVDDRETLERRAARLSDAGPEILLQEDIFFRVPRGRFKLRCFPEGHGELIYYERPDVRGPKRSSYTIHEAANAAGLAAALGAALGVAGRVRKERRLYLAGATRIHVDRVEGLGDFVELEVVLEPGQADADGARIAEELMESLGIREKDLVEGAYFDLLERSRRPASAASDLDKLDR